LQAKRSEDLIAYFSGVNIVTKERKPVDLKDGNIGSSEVNTNTDPQEGSSAGATSKPKGKRGPGRPPGTHNKSKN